MNQNWQAKLHSGESPIVARSIRVISGRPVGTLMLIPTPLQVDAYVRKLPRGVSKSVEEVGDELARENGAEITCPFTRGIAIRIVAEASNEELVSGKQVEEVTPFWRVLPKKTRLRDRLSFDVAVIDGLRAEEGLA